MARFALIDAAGLHTGFQLPPNDGQPTLMPGQTAVRVPDDCDLVPGRTRWDPAHGQFVFIGQEPVQIATPAVVYTMPAEPQAPITARDDALRAVVAELADALISHGVPVPDSARTLLDPIDAPAEPTP